MAWETVGGLWKPVGGVWTGLAQPASGWSPSDLYTGGIAGAFHDLSVSSLYTDDGVTAVSAPDDLIYRIDDISGNGVHLKQATLASRPPYKESGGYKWFETDGVDDVMPAAITATPSTGFSYFGAVRLETAQRFMSYISIRTSSNNQIGWSEVRTGNTGTGHVHILTFGDNGGANTEPVYATNTVGQDILFIAALDTVNDTVTLYINNDGGTSLAFLNTISDLTKIVYGMRDEGLTGQAVAARFYGGGFVNKVLTAQERTDLYTYFSARMPT